MQNTEGGTTGRYLVLLRHDKFAEGIRTLGQALGVESISAAAFRAGGEPLAGGGQTCFIVFERIGAAVMMCTPSHLDQLNVAVRNHDNAILAIEPERRVRAIGERASAFYQSENTWGIQATGVDVSSASGDGVRVAVLDTGLDRDHPDFRDRDITAQSFVEGEEVNDGHGHGTHCAGIACGPAKPMELPRYGVAYGAALFVGKVLGDQGGGGDGAVLEGINWAVENRCDIISMSLGSSTEIDQPYSEIFEEVARRALVAGTVIIAAAGNESARPEHIAPVSHPANCPSILAVAAVSESLDVAIFSSGGLAPDGGQVDIAAPGVNIRSAWPRPELYKTISGTSMATPFVAGIAALYAETRRARGRDLFELLVQNARELDVPPRDVGAGLAQAPSGRALQKQPQTPLSILVHPDDMHRFAEIVQCCKDAGLSVRREMTRIGVISGTIDSSQVDQLNAIKGVYRVEAERQVHAMGSQGKTLPPYPE